MSPGPTAAEFGPGQLAAGLLPLLGEGVAPPLVVALSGGADSAALLAAAAALVARDGRLVLRALHVNHGLSGAAALQQAAIAAARRLRVPLQNASVTVEDAAGDGLEAAARAARYAAFAAALAPGECLLTAHHCEDQAETLLLQLLRGAGLRGLAAMSAAAPLGAGRLLRPLLAVPRAALRAYAAAEGVPWHEDPMNAQLRYDRGYLRHELWPTLQARWPAAAVTLARTAAHLAAAQRLLDEHSQAQLALLSSGAALSVAGLRGLSPELLRELLRYWLRRQGLRMPATRRLAGFEREFLDSDPAASPRLVWNGGEIARHAGLLYAFAPLPPAAELLAAGPDLPPAPAVVSLGRLGALRIGHGPGEALVLPGALRARLGLREGGERLRLGAHRHERPVKDLLREAGIAPWARARALFLRIGGELVAIVLPGRCWIAADWRAPPGADGLKLEWLDAPAALAPPAFVEPDSAFR